MLKALAAILLTAGAAAHPDAVKCGTDAPKGNTTMFLGSKLMSMPAIAPPAASKVVMTVNPGHFEAKGLPADAWIAVRIGGARGSFAKPPAAALVALMCPSQIYSLAAVGPTGTVAIAWAKNGGEDQGTAVRFDMVRVAWLLPLLVPLCADVLLCCADAVC